MAGGGFALVFNVAQMINKQSFGFWDIVPIVGSLLILALGALVAAAGEVIGVLFAIEASTRLAADRLQPRP